MRRVLVVAQANGAIVAPFAAERIFDAKPLQRQGFVRNGRRAGGRRCCFVGARGCKQRCKAKGEKAEPDEGSFALHAQ